MSINRIGPYLDERPPDLLTDAHIIKVELTRFPNDDGGVDEAISYEVHGVTDDADTLAALLAQFTNGGKAGAE